MRRKLAIVTTHPIQYNAPFFRALSSQKAVELKVFYTWGDDSVEKFDPGFGKKVEWDIPLLEGYDFCFVENIASDPGSHHFFGINNPGLIRVIKDWQPAAVLIYGWSFQSHLRLLRHFKHNIPVLFRGDSTVIDQESLVKKYARRLFLTWVYRHVDIALYAGVENKVYFRKHGLKDSQLVFMPHAVDNNRFREALEEGKTQHREFLAENGSSDHRIRFLYAGKFTRNKNVSLLIAAFMEAALEDAELLLVGNGPEEESLKKMAKGSEQIKFLPFQNQARMPALLSLADVVVLPSKRAETWGLIINEAMACGKAVLVSSACGCAADLVQAGKNGQVFRNNDRNDLVQMLRKMGANREVLWNMGKASAQIIRDWSFEKGISALTTILGGLK